MGQVSVSINGREYRISCDDGQEERLTRLAGYVDDRVDELIRSIGNVGDLRLVVMASLLVADKLFDANSEVERLRAMVAQARQTAAPGSDMAVEPIVEAIVRRIDDIAAELETT